jgi:hypothetical protein
MYACFGHPTVSLVPFGAQTAELHDRRVFFDSPFPVIDSGIVLPELLGYEPSIFQKIRLVGVE